MMTDVQRVEIFIQRVKTIIAFIATLAFFASLLCLFSCAVLVTSCCCLNYLSADDETSNVLKRSVKICSLTFWLFALY